MDNEIYNKKYNFICIIINGKSSDSNFQTGNLETE